MPDFLLMAKCTVKTGDTIKFCTHHWTDNILKDQWPHLFSFAINENCSVKDLLASEAPSDLFHLPLSEEAFHEFGMLQEFSQGLELQEEKDIWEYTWGKSYSISQAYKFLQGPPHPEPTFTWLWKSCCQKKHKVFAWYLLHNRLNTRAMLQRKNFHLPDYNCIMCGLHTLETRDHLFFHCPFATRCWNHLLPGWIVPDADIHAVTRSFRLSFHQPFFMEVFILALWSIWITRNNHIFKGIRSNLFHCHRKFKEELDWVAYRANRASLASFKTRIQNFRTP